MAVFPVSDHCNGARFFNPGGSGKRGPWQLLRWRLAGGRARWPTRIDNPAYPAPGSDVPANHAGVTFIGHATFLLRLGGLWVLTDPVFSDRCSPVQWAGPRRVRAPGLALADLPPIDLVLLSHNHYDHMDVPSLRALQVRDRPAVVTTLGNAAALAALGMAARELDWWQTLQHGTLEVTATPARHFSRRGVFDADKSLWAGFMLRVGDGRLLFAGDSGAGVQWAAIRERLGAPGVALLPIGAYLPRWLMAAVHMNPAEAVQAHRDLGARRSVGMHFGTFQLTDEAVDAPVEGLLAGGVAEFGVLGFGETGVFPL